MAEENKTFNIKKGASVIVLNNSYTALADYYGVSDKDLIRVKKGPIGLSSSPSVEALIQAGVFNPLKNHVKNPN